jgi:hypothetical protein
MQIIPDDTDIGIWVGSGSSSKKWKWDTAGNFLPVGAGVDIGSPTAVVDNIYVSNVVVSGGSISGVSFSLSAIDNTVIGGAVPAAGTFTTATAATAVVSDKSVSTAAGTAFGTTATVVASFAKSSYAAAKYVVHAVDSAGHTQVAEVLVTHDNGANVAFTVYGAISTTGSTFATLTAAVNGANIELKAAGTGAGNTAKVQASYIA